MADKNTDNLVKIKTPSDLKHHVEQTGSLFFTRNNMKFAGDTMGNYGVRAQPVEVENCLGETHLCWELFRKRPVKAEMKDSAYFDCKTFKKVSKKINNNN